MVKVGRHVFQPGELLDWRERPTCALCPLPKDNEIHTVPEPLVGAADIDARILGEHDQD